MRAMLMSFAMILFAGSASAQNVPEAWLKMGDDYRWVWEGTGGAAAKLLFPKKSTGSNAIPSPADSRSVRWVMIDQTTDDTANQNVIIYSPAFPAGLDTVVLNDANRRLIFGGCRIDSVWVIGDILNPPQFRVTATD